MCSQQLSLLLWIRSSLHIKNLLSGMSFFFLNYLLAKVIYLLIRCYKTRFILRNKSNTDRNGVNKQNTHTTHTHTHTHTPSTPRKITLERVSIKIVITRLLSKQLWYFLVAVMVLHEKEKCKISKLKVHVNLAPLGGGGGRVFSSLFCVCFARRFISGQLLVPYLDPWLRLQISRRQF